MTAMKMHASSSYIWLAHGMNVLYILSVPMHIFSYMHRDQVTKSSCNSHEMKNLQHTIQIATTATTATYVLLPLLPTATTAT